MKGLLACVLMLSLLAGCDDRALLPYAREMGEMALMRTVGLDAGEDGVIFTAATGGRAGGRETMVLSASGVSIPAAALAVQSMGDSYVYYGHVDQLLVGEEQAVRGLTELMDYLAREPQLGLASQMWVVFGGSAARAIETAGERGVAQRLEQLNTDGEFGAANISRSAVQLMSVLARQGSTYLPALVLWPAGEGDEGQSGEQTLLPGGYAIVRNGKLVCRTDTEVSCGIELMEGENAGGVVDLSLEDGTKVSLVQDAARTVCRPVFQGDELTGLDVTCDLTVRVAQTGRRLKPKEVERLRQMLEQKQGERIVRAMELSQYWDADFLDLERRVQMAWPARKRLIQQQWENVFRALTLRVEVCGRIEQSYGMMDGTGG